MKKILLLILPMVFLFSDCKKDDDILFEMEYFHDFTIPAGLNPFAGTHIFENSNISSNFASIFAANTISAEDLVAINPGTSFLQGKFASPDNGYIQEISIRIFSPDDPTIWREVFYRTNVPENASGDLGLVGTLVDAKDFLTQETFGIRVELRLRDISPETIDMRLNFSFFAK